MDTVDRYYNYAIRMLQVIGIWPFDSNFRFIRFLFVNFVTSTFAIAEFAALMTGRYEINTTLILQTLCFAVILVGNVMKYNSYNKNSAAIRYIMNSIKNTWRTTDEDAREILEKHIKIGKQQGLLFSVLVYPGAMVLILNRTASYLIIITAPPQENFTDPFPMLMDYLVPQEKYFSLIVLHQLLTFFVTGLIPVATESVYIMWLQHGISLFEVAGYYFKKGFTGRPPTTSTKDIEIYRYECLKTAVRYNNEGFDFVTYVKDTFTFSYGFLILLSVVTLAMNVFRVSSALRVTHDNEELLLATSLTIVELFYMFYITKLMETAGRHGATLSSLVYNQPWYDKSKSVQRSVQIVLLGTNRTIAFDYYGFYGCTIESFAGLMKLSMSYLTIMLQFQGEEL